MKVLVTGATGDVGSRVVERLLEQGYRPRVFVRDERKARSRFGDRVDLSVGDFSDPPSLRRALEGIDVLFLLTSGPQIPELDDAAATAAKTAGVHRIVKLSSMDVQLGLAIGAWHERGEAAIRSSGMPFTFLQPTGFMSNLLAWTHSIKAEGVVRSSAGYGKRAFIHSDDIAAVAALVLTTRDYDGASLPITGPEALSFADATSKIGAAIGRRLTFQPISDEEARERFATTGASPLEVDAHVALWRAIREGRLAKATDNVERILGRKPVSLDQWAAENADAFR